MHLLPNISRSKGNQIMKLGQLTYNIKIIHNNKNYTQYMVEKLVPDPFLKNPNCAYLWINSTNFYKICFYCMPS